MHLVFQSELYRRVDVRHEAIKCWTLQLGLPALQILFDSNIIVRRFYAVPTYTPLEEVQAFRDSQ